MPQSSIPGIPKGVPKHVRHLRQLNGGPGWWQTQMQVEPPSLPWEPLVYIGEEDQLPGEHYEVWENSRYNCSVRRYTKGWFVKNRPYIVIGISNNDESSRHDWRDFQAIKNQLAGRDWEAVELYPAESRLKDPSNRFYLWCCEKGLLNFGLPGGRVVLDADEAVAPQRPFPKA
jgi:hypothetical protein